MITILVGDILIFGGRFTRRNAMEAGKAGMNS